jgi:hypothetical protein
MGDAGRTVTVEVDERHLRILDHNHELRAAPTPPNATRSTATARPPDGHPLPSLRR